MKQSRRAAASLNRLLYVRKHGAEAGDGRAKVGPQQQDAQDEHDPAPSRQPGATIERRHYVAWFQKV
jgi:hypothetical protein